MGARIVSGIVINAFINSAVIIGSLLYTKRDSTEPHLVIPATPAVSSLHASALATWSMILAVVATATAGDVLTAGAMRRIGDLDDIRAHSGLPGAIKAVVGSGMFVSGVVCMALSFFSLLLALSWADVSLVAPASASLTFISNAFAAKIFLKENVDKRRWLAALFVCAGVALLAK